MGTLVNAFIVFPPAGADPSGDYLLENGTDKYLLEDGSGVYVMDDDN